MENSQRQMPANVMKQIAQMHGKLKDAGLSDKTVAYSVTPKEIEGQIVYQHKLAMGATNLATYNEIDPRPKAEIKTQAEIEKASIQAKIDARKAELDAVITVTDGKVIAEK